MSIISLVSSKRGRLYVKFVLAAAIIIAAAFAYSVFASPPTSTPFITNSTFKWFKHTLYQPQNRSLVGYWKLDGNANGAVGL